MSQEKLFDEYIVSLFDEDSRMQSAEFVFVSQTCDPEIIETVAFSAAKKKDQILSLSGNHITYTLEGKTGKVCMGRRHERNGKGIWVIEKEIHPRNPDIDIESYMIID